VPDAEIERQFFDVYYGWMDAGGPAALYHHLLHLPLAGFHPHAAPPMTEGKEAMIDLGLSDLDRWLEAQRQEKPDLMQTAEEFLTGFTNGHLHAQVKTAGMSAALRRMGAVAMQVKVDGRRLRLWCLNPAWKDRPAHVWTEHYQKSQSKRPAAARAEAVSDEAIQS